MDIIIYVDKNITLVFNFTVLFASVISFLPTLPMNILRFLQIVNLLKMI